MFTNFNQIWQYMLEFWVGGRQWISQTPANTSKVPSCDLGWILLHKHRIDQRLQQNVTPVNGSDITAFSSNSFYIFILICYSTTGTKFAMETK